MSPAEASPNDQIRRWPPYRESPWHLVLGGQDTCRPRPARCSPSSPRSAVSSPKGARELAARAVTMAKVLLTTQVEDEKVARGGRKGSRPVTPESPADVAAMAEIGG